MNESNRLNLKIGKLHYFHRPEFLISLRFSELLKGHKIEDALHEASMAKKLEAEAIQALKELQAGLQANLNSDAVSIQIILLVAIKIYVSRYHQSQQWIQ